MGDCQWKSFFILAGDGIGHPKVRDIYQLKAATVSSSGGE